MYVETKQKRSITMKYATTNKLSEMTGYSRKAIYRKRENGIWRKNVHWIKSPDGRLQFIIPEIELWIQGGQANG